MGGILFALIGMQARVPACAHVPAGGLALRAHACNVHVHTRASQYLGTGLADARLPTPAASKEQQAGGVGSAGWLGAPECALSFVVGMRWPTHTRTQPHTHLTQDACAAIVPPYARSFYVASVWSRLFLAVGECMFVLQQVCTADCSTAPAGHVRGPSHACSRPCAGFVALVASGQSPAGLLLLAAINAVGAFVMLRAVQRTDDIMGVRASILVPTSPCSAPARTAVR